MAMDKDIWADISSELYREYLYADGSTIRVDLPMRLMVSASSLGGHAHRIQTEGGYAYYVPTGWRAIRWEAREGAPLFSY